MENSRIFIDLFHDIYENTFKIKTNLNKDKVNEILSECYRATLNSKPDYREFNKKDVYNIQISLDLSKDVFYIYSNTGNRVLTYELIKDSIDNWEILSEEVSVNKKDLEEMILKNKN